MTDIAARNRRNKRKGADWEIALVEGLREAGKDAERLRLNGVEDEGDIVIREDGGVFLVIEAKDNEAFKPGPFITEAEKEAANYAKHRGIDPDFVDRVVIVKRRSHSWRKAFVLTTVEDYFGLDIKP